MLLFNAWCLLLLIINRENELDHVMHSDCDCKDEWKLTEAPSVECPGVVALFSHSNRKLPNDQYIPIFFSE